MQSRNSNVDVLIIGAGPAGLMCANALALAGVNVRIIDKRPARVMAGHADGIATRTLEVLQSYGLAERFIQEGFHVHTFYETRHTDGIKCTKRIPRVSEPTARYPFAISLHQGAIESIFVDSLKNYGVEVERPREPSALQISDDIDELSRQSSFPVKVVIEHLDAIDDESKTEVVHAKFVLGADGAHSWVRKTLGIEMEGKQTEYIWGVLDAVLETNFPDIRNVAFIQSDNGSCLNVPREDDKTRLYIQLSETDVVDPSSGIVDKNRTSGEKLVSVAKRIFYPYELANPKGVEWWSVYSVGQRLASKYSLKNRVFIAGDACHTHSPKAGQGMNASINDAHNLAWKLVHVLRGWSRPSILENYEYERRKFAQDLINFDKSFAAMLSTKLKVAEDSNSSDDGELLQVLRKHEAFVSGIGIQYSPSAIVNPTHQKCAETLVIGKRMLPQMFVRAADIRPIDVHDLLPANVLFKILFFVGELSLNRITELNALADELNKSSSFLRKYSTDGIISTVFDIVTIIAGKKGEVNFLDIPAVFRPHWSKVLLDDTDMRGICGGDAYKRFKIDPTQTTVVVIRPDGYVGMVAPSTSLEDLGNYFGSFMIPRESRRRQPSWSQARL